MPFDEIYDFQDIADRLVRNGNAGELTFELRWDTKRNGCDRLIYDHRSVEDYFTQAYIRVCRVSAMVRYC